VTLALQAAVALVGGGAAILLASRMPRVGLAVAILASAIALGLGLVAGTDGPFVVGQAGLQPTPAIGALSLGWAAGLLLLGFLGLPEPARAGSDPAAQAGGLTVMAATTGAGLIGLGAALVALGIGDASVAFAALAAGGVVALAVPALLGSMLGREDGPTLGVTTRALAAIAGTGIIGAVVAAWGQAGAGPSIGTSEATDAAARASVGLAIVAMAAAVVLRTGAIPAHLWAARLVGSLSPLALPATLAWGAAAFTLVAVSWAGTTLSTPLDDLDRWAIVAVALASIVFGGLASLLHDDLEHVLGYVMVQDAGVALLAFAGLGPASLAALTTWVIAIAAVRTGIAGWIAAVRWTFGAHRVSELGGWARRSPMLAAALAIGIGASIGIPGMALFEARSRLVSDALPGPLATVVVILALSPLLGLGRVAVAGLGRPSADVAGASDVRTGRWLRGLDAWSRGGVGGYARAGGGLVRANAGLGVAGITVLLAVVGLVLAVAGSGAPTK